MNRPVRYFVALLALLALAGAQVFGLQRGFLCECSGEMVETSYEYCHHEHGDMGDMHVPCGENHHEHEGALPQDHHHENQGGSHEHTPLKVELTAASQGKDTSAAMAFVPLPSPLPFSELPDFLSLLTAAPGHAAAATLQLHRALTPHLGGSAFAAVQVARCTVLLV